MDATDDDPDKQVPRAEERDDTVQTVVRRASGVDHVRLNSRLGRRLHHDHVRVYKITYARTHSHDRAAHAQPIYTLTLLLHCTAGRRVSLVRRLGRRRLLVSHCRGMNTKNTPSATHTS